MCRHVPESPRPHVPESPRPRVPTSPRPRVPTSPSPRVPASPRPHVPTSPRPHVPESPRPHVPRPKSHVPVPLLVTALSAFGNKLCGASTNTYSFRGENGTELLVLRSAFVRAIESFSYHMLENCKFLICYDKRNRVKTTTDKGGKMAMMRSFKADAIK